MSEQVAEVSAKYIPSSHSGLSDQNEGGNLVPVGYKQTEVGRIPDDWDVVCLNEIVKQGRLPSGLYKDKSLYGTGTKIIKLGDVFNFDEFRPELAQRVLLSEDEKRSYCVEIGDIFIALASVKLEGVGKVMLVTKLDEPTSFDHNVALIRTVDEVNSDFLTYLLKSQPVRKLIGMNATQVGTTFLKASTILGFPLPFPPGEEQTAIANVLSDVDALISELEKMIAKKQAIKNATMQQLLTGRTRLPQFAQREDGSPKCYKPSELGEIPEDWEVYTLAQLIKSTQLGGNYKNSEQGSEQPLIKMGNLGRGYIKLDKLEFVVGKAKEVDRLKFGDLLFNTRNTLELVGKVSVWRNELPIAYFNSNLMRMTFNNGLVVSNFYMNAVMNSEKFVNDLSDIATGTTSVAAIYSRDLLQLKIALPHAPEQTAIATILCDMDEEIQALEQRLSKTRQIKQGMMQELLTGKTRLIDCKGTKA
tara:strand:+ start:978 stop:2399 length:1422 start_codon:yes stop_codon:yes gene_type:complete